jgi:hypothetical protein
VPPATALLTASHIIPVGGGGYLRLLPYRYTAAGIRRINRAEHSSACIYFHPWEIDTAQPRLASSPLARARTYFGLHGMKDKLARLMRDFDFAPLSVVCSDRSALPVYSLEGAPAGDPVH